MAWCSPLAGLACWPAYTSQHLLIINSLFPPLSRLITTFQRSATGQRGGGAVQPPLLQHLQLDHQQYSQGRVSGGVQALINDWQTPNTTRLCCQRLSGS